MLSKLIIKLNGDLNKVGYNSGSIFQGAIMEKLSTGYANKIHNMDYNPYSQYIVKKEEGLYWTICGINSEAYINIILPLLECDKIILKNKNLELSISDKKLETINREKFIEENLFSDEFENRIEYNFITPTAFKSKNKYIIIPDTRLIYQSLMKKFDSSGKEKIFSEEIIEQLNLNSYISKYSLRSRTYSLESIKIPSFMGSIVIKLETTNEIKKICRMLGKFAEYSGVGIKCSMGMGAVINGEIKNGW